MAMKVTIALSDPPGVIEDEGTYKNRYDGTWEQTGPGHSVQGNLHLFRRYADGDGYRAPARRLHNDLEEGVAVNRPGRLGYGGLGLSGRPAGLRLRWRPRGLCRSAGVVVEAETGEPVRGARGSPSFHAAASHHGRRRKVRDHPARPGRAHPLRQWPDGFRGLEQPVQAGSEAGTTLRISLERLVLEIPSLNVTVNRGVPSGRCPDKRRGDQRPGGGAAKRHQPRRGAPLRTGRDLQRGDRWTYEDLAAWPVVSAAGC